VRLISEEPSVEYEASPFENLVLALARLQLNAGLMDSVAFRWSDDTRANWNEKLDLICRVCYKEIEEIQAFAEAYDL
jgi:hypothetical protein